MNSEKQDRWGRRDVLRAGAALGVTAALGGGAARARPAGLAESAEPVDAEPADPVRIGYVGVGSMGSVHVKNLLKVPGAEIRAVCDIVPERVQRAQKWTQEAGFPKPVGYSRGPHDFERMCEKEDLDLVFTATPWRWHVPVCVAAMEAGKHAATEVPAATTLEGCWKLVETAERTRKHCVMMENCCYDRVELIIENMIRSGVFGELLHAEAGYMHELRGLILADTERGRWRLKHTLERNGNLYPTHGLGPVANYLDIHRGDRFDHLVSMSCKSLSLNRYAAEKFGPDSRQATRRYACGDVNTTLIRTALGRTVTLGFNNQAPRPYSRMLAVQGTRGIVRKYPEPKVFIDGRSPGHQWEPLEKYYEQYEHPLWKELAQAGEGVGHGGMDYIEDHRLVQALRTGAYPDRDVCDAAALSVVSPLSERSVAGGSRPVDFPDFTRGGWKTDAPPGGEFGAD